MSNATLADGSIVITVYGSPAPQGSKKAINHRTTGRAVVIESSNDNLKTWRSAVVDAAREARTMPCDAPNRHGDCTHREHLTPTIDGPVLMSLVFTLRKPVSAPKNRRTYPDKKPDVSKLQRAVEDALKDAGIYTDDARIVGYTKLFKVFPFEDPDALDVPGARIVVTPLALDPPPPGVPRLKTSRAASADHGAYP